MNQRQLIALALVAVAIWVFMRKAKAATPAPSVLGDVTSGDQSASFEVNVLNPNFGLSPGDVQAGSSTP